MAIIESLTDGTAVHVYNGREKKIGTGVVIDCYSSGIRVRLTEPVRGSEELTFFYAGGLTVVKV